MYIYHCGLASVDSDLDQAESPVAAIDHDLLDCLGLRLPSM